jgi:hypothetical protein
METSAPFLFAGLIGLGHAFEADHLLAVSNLVTRRSNLLAAAKDGIAWGLGHTTTILVIGVIMILGKVVIAEGAFGYLEALVGFMLMVLGGVRMLRLWRGEPSHGHVGDDHPHRVAYGVGLVHGLAGSGALVLLVMANIQGSVDSLCYLLIFGLGSVLGMLIAAGVLGLPFSRRLALNQSLSQALAWISSAGCLLYGGWIMFQHLSS